MDTRMDLWRLVAHANVCIDLRPGSYIARECVEALRFGTPIIVPECAGPAVVHAREGGGATLAMPASWWSVRRPCETRAFDPPRPPPGGATPMRTSAMRKHSSSGYASSCSTD